MKPTVAILCRTNFECQQWADALQNVGIKVARRKQPGEGMPEGWETLRKTIRFFAEPANDHLAFQFLLTVRTKQTAETMRADAIRAKKSINDFVLGFPQNPDTSPPGLKKFLDSSSAVPLATVDWLCDLLREAPAGQTMESISLMLIEHENRGLDQVEDGEVYVGTIHSAKAREWAHCILVGWNEGLFPKGNDEISEARRLAFVAITRAKSSVLISGARQRRTQWNGTVEFLESRFIKEICQPK